MANNQEYAPPPVDPGDEITFEDEDGRPVKATVTGFHEGVPMLSEPEPAESPSPGE